MRSLVTTVPVAHAVQIAVAAAEVGQQQPLLPNEAVVMRIT